MRTVKMGTGDHLLEGTLSGDTYTTTAKYVWEGNSYYDPLLFAYEGGAWKHPMYDGLGSTRQLLDNTTQNVTDTYAYEAFGNLMDSSGSTPNPYKYVGSLGYYATGSSLQHLGARYYMPEVGRFLSIDPASADLLYPLTINAYIYGLNCPILFVDPAGEIAWFPIIAGIVCAIFVIDEVILPILAPIFGKPPPPERPPGGPPPTYPQPPRNPRPPIGTRSLSLPTAGVQTRTLTSSSLPRHANTVIR